MVLNIMPTTLEQITTLGEALQQYKQSLNHRLSQVEELKEHIRQIEEETLPTLMDDQGIEDMSLACGAKISCKDFVVARIKDQRTAFDWLRETNNDGIIKNEIKVELGRGDDEQAAAVENLLVEHGIPATRKESIHYQTLNAFIREAVSNPELNETLPKEAFGVYETRKVTIK